MPEKIVIDSDAIDAEIAAGDRLQELVFQRAKVIALEAKVPHSEPDTYVVTLAHMEQAIAEHDTAALLARAESAESKLRHEAEDWAEFDDVLDAVPGMTVHDGHGRAPTIDKVKWLADELRIVREVNSDLIAQLQAALSPSQSLPRAIVELIYVSACCQPTPEASQKEPCACVAAAIVEKAEEWCAARVKSELARCREELAELRGPKVLNVTG